MFQCNANLVLKVGLDGDLQTVRDTFAVLPHVVDQQAAERCHAVANRETQIRHTAVHLGLRGGACNTWQSNRKGGDAVFMKTMWYSDVKDICDKDAGTMYHTYSKGQTGESPCDALIKVLAC